MKEFRWQRDLARPWRAWLLLGAFLLAAGAHAQEICDNAIDDDGDGLVDLNDTADCACGGITIVDGSVASLVPNSSFEQYDQLPNFLSQLGNCTDWSQATEGTSDYYYDPTFNMLNVPTPLPHGHGYVGIIISNDMITKGDHDEYMGCQLLAPLQAGVPYTLQAYIAGGGIVATPPYAYIPPWTGPVDLTLYGLANVPLFPVGVFGCPAPAGWAALGHATYQAQASWSVITITFTPPVNMAAIMIGAPCQRPADHVYSHERGAYPYYLLDDLVLNTSSRFSGVVVPSGSHCSNDLRLTALGTADVASHQWYLNGVAIVGQTSDELAVSLLGLGTGDYTCVVRDADNNCTALEHALIDPVAPVIELQAGPRAGCRPLNVHFSSPSGVVDLSWTFNDGTTVHGDSVAHVFTQSGVFDVMLQFNTQQGCSFDTVFQDIITVYPKPEIGILVDPPGAYEGGASVLLEGFGTNVTHWAWAFNGQAPYVVLGAQNTPWTLPDAPGTYQVALYGRNAQNCLDTAYVRLVVEGCDQGSVFVPSAFSPDGSGRNDRLCVYGRCIERMTFRVFDRWGTKVYESFSPEECWDGQHNGTPLNAGVFAYHLFAALRDGTAVERQGNITLVR